MIIRYVLNSDIYLFFVATVGKEQNIIKVNSRLLQLRRLSTCVVLLGHTVEENEVAARHWVHGPNPPTINRARE